MLRLVEVVSGWYSLWGLFGLELSVRVLAAGVAAFGPARESKQISTLRLKSAKQVAVFQSK
jgi:hypothetical protein